MGNEYKKIIPNDETAPKAPANDREKKKNHRGDNFPRNRPKPQEKNKGQKF
jgi:hypothetical protein